MKENNKAEPFIYSPHPFYELKICEMRCSITRDFEKDFYMTDENIRPTTIDDRFSSMFEIGERASSLSVLGKI